MELKPGIYTGIRNEDYHADRTAVSSTWLKKIEKSPFHLKSYLSSPPAESTPALIMGSAVDCLIFEPDEWNNQFIIAPEINRRTNAGKDEWAALLADAAKTKRQLISEADHFEALQTAKAVRTNPVMADIMSSGSAQKVFVWEDPVTGLLCKCKADWYDEASGTLMDLKTGRDADPVNFAKAIANFGYHIQAAFYTDGVVACKKPVKRFIFGVIEKPDGKDVIQTSPELMAFYELDPADLEAGQDTYSSGLAAINFCMINDEWPGYTNRIIPISRPAWARKGDVESVATL